MGVSEAGAITSQLMVSTYYGLVRLLATCASGSHSVAETLLQSALPETLRRLLASSPLFSSTSTSSSSVLRSTDQLLEVRPRRAACALLRLAIRHPGLPTGVS